MALSRLLTPSALLVLGAALVAPDSRWHEFWTTAQPSLRAMMLAPPTPSVSRAALPAELGGPGPQLAL